MSLPDGPSIAVVGPLNRNAALRILLLERNTFISTSNIILWLESWKQLTTGSSAWTQDDCLRGPHPRTVPLLPLRTCVLRGKHGFKWLLRKSRASDRSTWSRGSEMGKPGSWCRGLSSVQRRTQSARCLDQLRGISWCPFKGSVLKTVRLDGCVWVTEHVTENFHFLVSLPGWIIVTVQSTF